MAFNFKPPDLNAFHDYLENEKAKIFESMKESFNRACQDAVNKARSTDTYLDQSGNLRSSIGYVLYFDGICISENFESSGTGNTTGQDGVKSSKHLAHEVAKRFKSSWVAVIVAGMNYALYVESNGYDVITGSTLNITEKLQEHFDEVNKKHFTNYRAK